MKAVQCPGCGVVGRDVVEHATGKVSCIKCGRFGTPEQFGVSMSAIPEKGKVSRKSRPAMVIEEVEAEGDSTDGGDG